MPGGMSAVRQAWRKIVTWWREPPPTTEAPWVARQVKANCDAIEALEARVAAAEAQAAQTTEAFCQAFMAAGKTVPDAITADMPTTPLLRIVS